LNRVAITFHVSALASGLLFGLGLAVSGMISPAKVRAFLDLAAIGDGRWDPSLACVLAAAVIVTMGAVRIGHRRRQPVAAPAFVHPEARRIDLPLIGGSILFGIGWGIAGLCPGPAIADIAFVLPNILIFLVPMLAGSALVHYLRRQGKPEMSEDPNP
jgi:uncharacterized membrane protein YedE/YeeE